MKNKDELCLLFPSLLCVSVVHSPSLERANGFIGSFPGFHIPNSHATCNVLFLSFPHSTIFPGLSPSSNNVDHLLLFPNLCLSISEITMLIYCSQLKLRYIKTGKETKCCQEPIGVPKPKPEYRFIHESE